MNDLIQRIRQTGVIPVIRIDDAEDVLPLAQALKNGGLWAAEITLRTSAAQEALRRVAAHYPDFLLIAGTVLTIEQADQAMAAGARAIVSPGTSPAVVRHCLEKGYPIIPGVCTPSEVEMNLALGLTHLKFFPAEAAGGVKMINALSAPYPQVRFMPTGGISLRNLTEYLRCQAVFACGGSWMVPSDKIAAGHSMKSRLWPKRRPRA